MGYSIIDILDTDKKQTIVVKSIEQYINRCNAIANGPMRGYGSVTEKDKKDQWAEEAKFAQSVLNDIITELN